MNRDKMIELCNALREIAQSIELVLAREGLTTAEQVDVDAILRGALLELCKGLGLELELELVELGERERLILYALGGQKQPGEVLRYLAASMCDGVRRPGSWERGCVTQLFGHDRTIDAEAEIEG